MHFYRPLKKRDPLGSLFINNNLETYVGTETNEVLAVFCCIDRCINVVISKLEVDCRCVLVCDCCCIVLCVVKCCCIPVEVYIAEE